MKITASATLLCMLLGAPLAAAAQQAEENAVTVTATDARGCSGSRAFPSCSL